MGSQAASGGGALDPCTTIVLVIPGLPNTVPEFRQLLQIIL